jgi:phosphoribosylaminoimidazole-succinocarboxamide synthase
MKEVTPALFESRISSLPLIARGKVRDVYAVGEAHLLLVTTDRLSAFDVVFPTPIPGKGRILNTLSNFWFKKLAQSQRRKKGGKHRSFSSFIEQRRSGR